MNVKFLAATIILVLIYSYEHTRLTHAYHDCTHQHAADRELLLRDICIFPEERQKFAATVDCAGAERRQRITVLMCTMHKWSSESNLASIWHSLTSSYWSIAGILLPLLISYMYFWSQRKLQMDMMGRFGEFIGRGGRGDRNIRSGRSKERDRNAISYR